MSLLVHKGGKIVTRDDLPLVEVPEATETYFPVPHHHLADTLSTIGQDILKGFTLAPEQYALAREGDQMFGVLVFQQDHSELGLSIGFRNSYDKSMAIGIATGAEVFVCDNLALTGDITVLKKHTSNVWASLEDTAKIPPGTQSGTVFRLGGRGVPALDGGGRGDQYVHVHVRVPERLTPEQRELIEQLASLGGEETSDRSLFDRVKDVFR